MPNPDTSTTLLTAAELARQYGRNVRTVHRMVRSGRLSPAMKLPGRTGALLFRAEDAEAAFAPAREAS